MLVLTRKQGETIRIGKDIVVTVIRTKGKAVRLGVKAPHQVSVLRGELVEQPTTDEAPQPSAASVKSATVAAASSTPPGADANWPAAQSHPQRPPRAEQALAPSGGGNSAGASIDSLHGGVAREL